MNTSHCWNEIGIAGDHSCDQLEAVGHCRNCSTYRTEGRRLFERNIPLDYLQEWTATLAQPSQRISTHQVAGHGQISEGTAIEAAMIFRLGSERFALPVEVLQEITRPQPIHTLPHRSTDLFLGLVNIRGEILPCVSLNHLLSIEMLIDATASRVSLRRMIVMGSPQSRWVFLVDEVDRIYRFWLNQLQPAPSVITKADKSYTQGIIDWQSQKVNYLNAKAVLEMLDRRIL